MINNQLKNLKKDQMKTENHPKKIKAKNVQKTPNQIEKYQIIHRWLLLFVSTASMNI